MFIPQQTRTFAFLGVGLAALVLAVAVVVPRMHSALPTAAAEEAEPPIDAQRSFGYLKALCDLGPRPSGSTGMERQQRLIAEHFTELGAKVRFQSFDAAHPKTGKPVQMNNIIVTWHPQANERVLLACHYDTRPLPDRDRNPRLARQGRFVGANDGASGVAVLMELGHHIKGIAPRYGVDFVFFDGEELVYHPNDPYFLGSEHFAKNYRDQHPSYRYLMGVVIDMVGDKELNIYKETNSLNYAPSITESIWKAAKAVGVKEFIGKEKHEVRDDHLPLNQIAGIPTCDVIDFDFDYWHTTKDVPASCSAASLGKVAKVMLAWLDALPDEPPRRGR
jgi:hypothetical protein